MIGGFNQQDAQGLRSSLRIYIGISISPNDGEDVSSLLSSAEKAAGRAAQQAESALCFADSASQQAKHLGRNRVLTFNPADGALLEHQRQLRR